MLVTTSADAFQPLRLILDTLSHEGDERVRAKVQSVPTHNLGTPLLRGRRRPLSQPKMPPPNPRAVAMQSHVAHPKERPMAPEAGRYVMGSSHRLKVVEASPSRTWRTPRAGVGRFPHCALVACALSEDRHQARRRLQT